MLNESKYFLIFTILLMTNKKLLKKEDGLFWNGLKKKIEQINRVIFW